ncbi:MAG: CHAT domain-containing protein [Alkalinema sp. RU_4_3]|nr:CHAT domain-containing protein [Alkalinema sp. RU_4_3]
MPPEDFDRASIKIVRTQTSTAPDPSGTQLRQGYDLLIKPIADLLPKNPDDRIIIIPQGSLFLVPFQALQNDRGQFLIENHTLSPSILTLSLTKPAGKTTAQPLIVGNPSPLPKGFSPPTRR